MQSVIKKELHVIFGQSGINTLVTFHNFIMLLKTNLGCLSQIALKNMQLLVLITCCAKLLEFDWWRGIQLIRNCTGQVSAKICDRGSIGCFCRSKSCNCSLIGYFCCAKSCNSPWLDNFG